MRHKKGNSAVNAAFFVQSNLTSHLLHLELSCQLGIVSLLLSKIRLTFVLRIPRRNQNLYTSEPFLKVLLLWGFISHSVSDLGFSFLLWLLKEQPLHPLSHLLPHDVDTVRIFPPCTTHTRAFPLQGSLFQLPSQQLPGGKPAVSEITEKRTAVSKGCQIMQEAAERDALRELSEVL